MNTTGLTEKGLVDALDRTIKELEYPPLHATVTRDDVLSLLKICRDALADKFNLIEDEDDLTNMRRRIESCLDDIDAAVWQIKNEL